jgi:murein DD-endopeptidase MepM/ murein hydrolase activator NlpD
VAIAALVLVVLAVAAPVARARLEQASPPTTLLPPLGPTTTTEAPPPSSDATTTTEPALDTTSTTPAGGDGTTDGGLSPLGGGPGQIVPPEAEAFISSLRRSAPNDDRALVENEQALLAAGYDPDQAARLAYGHFPVAGPAHWSDDWLDPRFDGTEFRYHYGIDVIAAYGTPLRAPDDGVIGIEQSEAGGLTVKVVRPDGTFYEMAHLSATAPGLEPGAAVHTGDPVGFVGATGDATGPHLHLGLWVGGATPRSPKPLLDQWVADAAAAGASVLAPPAKRSMLGTAITRDLLDGDGSRGPAPLGASSTELVLASVGSPNGGALQIAKATAVELAEGVDWTGRAAAAQTARRAWAASTARAWRYLAPLTPAALRPLLAPARATSAATPAFAAPQT